MPPIRDANSALAKTSFPKDIIKTAKIFSKFANIPPGNVLDTPADASARRFPAPLHAQTREIRKNWKNSKSPIFEKAQKKTNSKTISRANGWEGSLRVLGRSTKSPQMAQRIVCVLQSCNSRNNKARNRMSELF